MKLKGVIFDFNGVIIDDYPLQKEAWNTISKKLRGTGVNDSEMLNQIRGVRTADTIRRMSGGKLSELEVKKISEEKDSIIRDLLEKSPLFHLNHGLEKFFNDLKTRGIPITIATSQSHDNLMLSFKRLNLSNWFDLEDIFYNDGTYPGKPAPDSYILAAKKLGLNPAECLVFEDAINGIESAYSAGVRNIVAVGSSERLKELTKQPGVIKGIQNFTEVKVSDYF